MELKKIMVEKKRILSHKKTEKLIFSDFLS